ncbi:MAG: hypothetical protein AB7V13_26810 [Pseudorhodoplanes sp.]|uniref:hypothetical protein n=1 Tax=Pseudorhodoplanes sp. TaxID=1934341 RepID=UPI003D117364
MDAFARFAFFTIARDAGVSAFAAGILMIAYSFNPPLALVLGASVAMFFAGVMLFRALMLSEDRVVSTEPWQVMEPEQRPVGDDGRAVACERLETMLLGAAKNAAGIASVMFGLGLLTSWA